MTVKITALPEAASILPTDLLVTVIDPGGSPVTKKITAANFGPQFHPLTAPLTSTAWDGDAFSTAAKTLIDLSAVFSATAGIKAALVRMIARDSGSAAGTGLFFSLSPNDTAGSTPMMVRLDGLTNDYYAERTGVCPCDANGDIYYQIAASGAGTMDCHIQIWGYWI